MSFMVDLTRTVRFCVGPGGRLADDAPTSNSFAAWPPMRGLGSYYELHVSCRGAPDETTGYLMNIKHIDQAARSHALPVLAAAMRGAADSDTPDPGFGKVLQGLLAALQTPLRHSVTRVGLQLTPRLCLTIEERDVKSVIISHQYEFSAAHRLHVPELTPEKNREVFGKCNNPAGHGHNYQLEVAVRSPVDDTGGTLAIEQFDALVDRVVIERFDHTHLNEDRGEFASLNPSVENIARVIYELLEGEVGELGASLEHVRVWETEKTVCTYAG